MDGRGQAAHPGTHQGKGRGGPAGLRGSIAGQVLLLLEGWVVLHSRDQADRMPQLSMPESS